MTATHAGTHDLGRPSLRARVLAWVTRPDNARTDFRIIGLLNAGVGLVLAVAPHLAHSQALSTLMRTAPAPVWATAFLLTGAAAEAGLRARHPYWSARARHAAWVGAGTLLAMWIVGVLWSTGSVTTLLLMLALLAWYTLTLARLELPRLLQPHPGSG